MSNENIYNPQFVSDLFDSMSRTYGLTNYISSFGFTRHWRQCCVDLVKDYPHNNPIVFDLMSGMGELWPSLRSSGIEISSITGIDISEEMNKRALDHITKTTFPITVLQQDILNNEITDSSADIIVSSFGLKTFNLAQQKILARETARILKPGGRFSFVEISVPKFRVLRQLYLFYLKVIIPIIGFLFAGNSKDYRMLGIYTQNFSSCRPFAHDLRNAGLEVNLKDLFFGCASATWGRKPDNSNQSI